MSVACYIILSSSWPIEKKNRLVNLFSGKRHKRKTTRGVREGISSHVMHLVENSYIYKPVPAGGGGINPCWYVEMWQLKDVRSCLLENMLQARSLAKVGGFKMVGWVDRSQMCWHMEASANAIQPVVQCQQYNDRTGWTPANGHKWWRTTVTSTCMPLIYFLATHLETNCNCLAIGYRTIFHDDLSHIMLLIINTAQYHTLLKGKKKKVL